MSGPQDLQRIGQMFGGPTGAQARPSGPKPTMPIGQTAKRMGDSRVPMSKEIPQRNPGAVQTQAAIKLGVRPNQVQPVPRTTVTPPRAQGQPAAQPQVRPQTPPAAPRPQTRDEIRRATEIDPRTGNPYPAGGYSRDEVANLPPRLPRTDPRQGSAAKRSAAVTKALEARINSDSAPLNPELANDLGSMTQIPVDPKVKALNDLGEKPTSGIQAQREWENRRKQIETTGGSSLSSANATPGNALTTGSSQEDLIRAFANAERQRDENKQREEYGPIHTPPAQAQTPTNQDPFARVRPTPTTQDPFAPRQTPTPRVEPAPQPPAATQPKPIITNPTPPGTKPRPPEAFDQSKGTFGGYEIIKDTPKKVKTGNEKQVVNRGDKGNSAFLYRKMGPTVPDWDNVALGQAMKVLRAKAADPKRKVPMTENEVRLLTQNADVGTSNRGVPLESMLPEAIKRRLDELNSRIGKSTPVRNEERITSGATPPSTVPPGPIVPKTTQGRTTDPAMPLVNDAVQNSKLTQDENGIWRHPDGTEAQIDQL